MKLLCYKNVKISINLFLQELYKKPFILQLILMMKHCKNTKNFEKFISYYVTKIAKSVNSK